MKNLLQRSDEFELALAGILEASQLPLYSEHARHRYAANSSVLSIEHGRASRISFTTENPNSGTALIRLQFESLVRAAWLLYVASDTEVNKLDQPLNHEAEHLANSLPGSRPMLIELEKKVQFPGLVQPLLQFQELSRKSLNSYVHAGIHPLSRVSEGFPEALASQVIQSSNGLLHMGYRLLALLTGSQVLMNQMTSLYKEFTDCLPQGPVTHQKF